MLDRLGGSFVDLVTMTAWIFTRWQAVDEDLNIMWPEKNQFQYFRLDVVICINMEFDVLYWQFPDVFSGSLPK